MLEAHEPDFNPTYMYIVECLVLVFLAILAITDNKEYKRLELHMDING